MATSDAELLVQDNVKQVSDVDRRALDTDVEPNTNSSSSSLPVQSVENEELSTVVTPVPPEQTLDEESAVKMSNAFNEVSPEKHGEGEQGWEPVQKPRSASLFGRRLRQKRQHASKMFIHQKKDLVAEADHARQKNNHQSGKYYVVKKKTISPGSLAEYYVAKGPSPGSKFGRKLVKTVAYRVKSAPLPTVDSPTETNKSESEKQSEQGPVSVTKEVGPVAKRSSIVSLGKSPSYKEVALAPPGTLTMLQEQIPDDDLQYKKEFVECDDLHNEVNGKSEHTVSTTENNQELTMENLLVGSVSQLNETEAFDMKLDHLDVAKADKNIEIVSESYDEHVNQIAYMPNLVDSPKVGIHTDDPVHSSTRANDDLPSKLQGIEELNSPVSGTNELKEASKLSASAAPFSPSLVAPRVAPLPLNLSLPSAPGSVPPIGPWPINMTLHPGPTTMLPNMRSSPHHPYPSPTPTPIIHQISFMYPPYTQAQSMPPTSFPVNTGPFHPGQFAWQCNLRANPPEYIPITLWPACHPIEFTPSSPTVQTIAEPALETKEESDNSENASLAPLTVDLEPGTVSKKDIELPASEAVDSLSDIHVVQSETGREFNVSDQIQNVLPLPNILSNSSNGGNEQHHVHEQQQNADKERTFNILMRGRRNRKQMLRMPYSLLKRPYSSQSFKVVYTRVVRETEFPRTSNFDSRETNTVNAT